MNTQHFVFPGGDASLDIAVDFGCNLCSWIVKGRELLYREAGFGTDRVRMYEAGGTPLLFPSVGRTWDRTATPPAPDRYRLAGHSGALSMPCHGILPLGKWEPAGVQQTASEVRVEYRFTCAQGVLDRHYPFTVELRHRFILKERSLALEATLVNHGSIPAPAAVGWHPYWRLAGDEVFVRLPCTQQVELDPRLLVPSGKTRPFAGELRASVAQECDVAFGGITGTRACLIDEANGYTVTLDTDASVGNWVIYSAAGRPFVCIEPWTKGLGAYEHLSQPDWMRGEYLPVLAPGEARTMRVTFSYSTP